MGVMDVLSRWDRLLVWRFLMHLVRVFRLRIRWILYY